MKKTKNQVTMKMAKKVPAPQCPECGGHNVKHTYKRYVDFYGVPKVFKCDCGWEREITKED